MPTATKASPQVTCDGCWTEQTLRPSGTALATHKAGTGERCPGKPVYSVKGGDLITCPECGKEGKPLKTDATRILRHKGEDDEICQQREGVKAKCPSCARRIGLVKHLLANHKDPKTNARCIHAGHSPLEKVEAPFAGARQGKAPAEPKPKRAPMPKGIDAAFAKAQIFASTIEKAGWQTEVVVDKDALAATAVAKRGEEEITIMWEEARCVGGTIFHTFRTRKIALRNKNAAVQRALMPPDAILAEHSRVSHRARTKPTTHRTGRSPAERPKDEMKALRAMLPFDPRTADQTEIARAIASKTLMWRNRTSGKEESGTVNGNERAIRVSVSKADQSRQVTFFLLNSGAKTIRLADLVSVG